MTNDEAQKYGSWLKLLIKYMRKFPAGTTDSQLCKEFPISRVGNNLGAIIELAIAAELIEECYDENITYYKVL